MTVRRETQIVVRTALHNEREYGSLRFDPDGRETVTLSLDSSVGPWIPGVQTPEKAAATARQFSLADIEQACAWAREMAVHRGFVE